MRLPGVVRRFLRRRGSRSSLMISDWYMNGKRDRLGDHDCPCPLPPPSSSYRPKISPSLSWVHRCHPPRPEQATNIPTGYTPSDGLAIVGVIAYGIIGLALLFRVVRSKAWWALCLPMGSFSEHPHLLFLSRLKHASRRSVGLHPPSRGQLQTEQRPSIHYTATTYRLLTSCISCLQLHPLRSPHLSYRYGTFESGPPEGGKDIRYQRHLHLLDTGSYQPLQRGMCVQWMPIKLTF